MDTLNNFVLNFEVLFNRLKNPKQGGFVSWKIKWTYYWYGYVIFLALLKWRLF
jgi:hypothetical protein